MLNWLYGLTSRQDAEEIYSTYKKHAIIEASCPALFVKNEYFKSDFHKWFHQQCMNYTISFNNVWIKQFRGAISFQVPDNSTNTHIRSINIYGALDVFFQKNHENLFN